MKQLILIGVLSSFVSCAVAAEGVVGARVVKSGLIGTQAAFVVEAGLTNTSSEPLRCAIMSCARWAAWRVSPSIFEVRGMNYCFSNFPEEFYLGAHESTTFKFQVICRGTNVPPKVTRMKVGFAIVPWNRVGENQVPDLFEYSSRIKTSSETVVWSDEFDLPPVGTQSIEEWNERR
jgi:hypothetical protein